jgi:electron transfer flavoprotein beta subunit
MEIVVPVKRVAYINVKVRVKPDGLCVDTANVKMSTSPFDEIAVEEAVRLRGAGVASEVIAVSAGVAQCQETLRSSRQRCLKRASRDRSGSMEVTGEQSR